MERIEGFHACFRKAAEWLMTASPENSASVQSLFQD
jgi:hypothetical protein